MMKNGAIRKRLLRNHSANCLIYQNKRYMMVLKEPIVVGKNGHSPRNIYMRLYTSEDVKYYWDFFRKLNIHQKTKIKTSPQFSKKVTGRRNQAMLERKNLIDKANIKSGFIEYPATLMVKREGDRNYVIKQKF